MRTVIDRKAGTTSPGAEQRAPMVSWSTWHIFATYPRSEGHYWILHNDDCPENFLFMRGKLHVLCVDVLLSSLLFPLSFFFFEWGRENFPSLSFNGDTLVPPARRSTYQTQFLLVTKCMLYQQHSNAFCILMLRSLVEDRFPTLNHCLFVGRSARLIMDFYVDIN